MLQRVLTLVFMLALVFPASPALVAADPLPPTSQPMINLTLPTPPPVTADPGIQRNALFFENRFGVEGSVQTRAMGGEVTFASRGLTFRLPTTTIDNEKQALFDGAPTRPANTYAGVEMSFQGTLGAHPVPVDRLAGHTNYLIGDNPTEWRTMVPTYSGVTYQDLYPGIDLAYNGPEGSLKGTYFLNPLANPAQIRWQYTAGTTARLDETGTLIVGVPGDTEQTLSESPPVAWQGVANQRVRVSVAYEIADDGSIGFAVGEYDVSLPLTIDPTFGWSKVLPDGQMWDVSVDKAGNVYVAGHEPSDNAAIFKYTSAGTLMYLNHLRWFRLRCCQKNRRGRQR